MSATARLDAVLAHAEATLEPAIGRWLDFLRIPSVSAQPAHAADCRAAAAWAAAELAALGFVAEIRETGGQPVVLAQHPGPDVSDGSGHGPHLLYYGHYDVQPPEPLELWRSPPFEPAIVEGPHGRRVVARGAVDDKGQLCTWLTAFRAWHTAGGGLPVRATVLIEGEEEIGSPNLEPFLAAHRALLAADAAVISDTGMWDIATPAITTRLRGLAYVEIALHAATRDLHSGLFGGSARNPLALLSRILADLHDAQGHVQLPGFYDTVRPIPPETARQWAALGFDEAAFLGGIGLAVPAGEAGLPALARLWARPTAEINGIWGGYTGAGAKTVIPAAAHAKLSFRLVPDQDPDAVIAALRGFIAARLPADCRFTLDMLSRAPAVEIPTDTALVAAARAALAEEYGRPAVMLGSGGSIPVVESLRRALGIDSLLMGFGLDDDGAHSPGEKFEIACFRHGLRAHVRLLAKFAPG